MQQIALPSAGRPIVALLTLVLLLATPLPVYVRWLCRVAADAGFPRPTALATPNACALAAAHRLSATSRSMPTWPRCAPMWASRLTPAELSHMADAPGDG